MEGAGSRVGPLGEAETGVSAMKHPAWPGRALQHGRGTAARRPSQTRKSGRVAASTQLLLPPLSLAAAAIVSSVLFSAPPAQAQAGACQLIADDRNPPEKILRCGDALEVRSAHQTDYQPVDQAASAPPNAIQLDSGALMIAFHPSKGRKHFQILTPNAIAAVRGTKLVVEVAPARTSTFVVAGKVAVSRPNEQQTVVLRPGEGADVAPDGAPIVVKRWAKPRVQALLARFGE
jgi:hypothetical protein